MGLDYAFTFIPYDICLANLPNQLSVNAMRTRADRQLDRCPLTKLKGGLQSFHDVEDDALKWLKSTATAVLAAK